MCGILICCEVITRGPEGNHDGFANLYAKLRDANAARGPDAQESYQLDYNDMRTTFFGSELCLRGASPVSQPHRDDTGHILCWNGEIFEGLPVAENENDGSILFNALCAVQDIDSFIALLGDIEGPYAIVYYNPHLKKLLFARDPIGRRSLLIHKPTADAPRFLLTSVSAGSDTSLHLEELPTTHIYALDVERWCTEDLCAGFTSCLELYGRQGAVTKSFAEPERVNGIILEDPPRVQSVHDIPAHLITAVDQLIHELQESVRLQVSNIPQVAGDKGKARVAVLFSGGIDSTMLAFLADRHVNEAEPIDLLNVAFENPRKILVQAEGNIGGLPKREKKQKLKSPTDYNTVDVTYHVPDRATGLQELEELRRLCPHRTWNFIEVNVPFEEYQAARPIVEALMFPGRTVMDLSLAIALYFAARGVGQVRDYPGAESRPYTTPARVLLNGLGSDELLGGYGRFRTTFMHGGWKAIIDELQLELDRIPTRNLGRDDRVISSHGKETRHPFLSLSVVSFLARLPVHVKLDPRLETGLGEKMLLRLAANKLGLVEAAGRKKRAMQFGSHSARMVPGEGDKKGDLLLSDRLRSQSNVL